MKSIFQRIIDKEIPVEIIYEDGLSLVFKDINPVAPKHFLVIPKKPIINLQHIAPDDMHIVMHLVSVIQKVAAQENLAPNGYRVVTNIGDDGGQTVDHLHLHIIGGRPLRWPPG